MKKRLLQDKTITTIKERINTPDGYKIITTTKTKHDKTIIDTLIDLLS